MTAASAFLTYALHSVILGAVALCCGTLFRRYPALRTSLWKVTLIVPLLTTSFVLVRGEHGTLGVASLLARVIPVAPARVDVDVREIRGVRAERVERVRDPVGQAIGFACLALLIHGIVGAGFVVRRRNRFVKKVAQVRPLAGPVVQGAKVVETDLVEIPVALASGLIALPAGFMSRGTERSRKAILLHEMAHVNRKDPAWVDFARLVAAMTPWQPLNRLFANRLEHDVELAADASALAMGADAAGLVEGLAYFAARALTPLPAGASLVGMESPLVQRAEHLLGRPLRPPRRAVIVSAVGILVLTASAMTMLPSVSPGFARDIPGAGTEVLEIDIRGKQPGR